MIEKALKYLVNLGEAKTNEVYVHDAYGQSFLQTYSDKPLHLLKPEFPLAEELHLSTLTSLIEYIKSNTDALDEKMLIHIVSAKHVRLISMLNANRQRETVVDVCADEIYFDFNTFLPSENFIIGVQSKFIDDSDTDKALILTFAGTMEVGTVQQYSDDGVSQSATIKNGIASKVDALVPQKVIMCPYRTFLEVEQPKSEFIFRVKNTEHDVKCALFNADGGKWEIEAKNSIKEYLTKELENYNERFTIIS